VNDLAVRRPCPDCPWRKDNPSPGKFPQENFEAMRSTTGVPGAEAPIGASLFACHHSKEDGSFVCAGWLAAVGIENLTARYLATRGIINPKGFQPGDDWPELYEDYDSMLAAQGFSDGE
jgi:hypothetical protein